MRWHLRAGTMTRWALRALGAALVVGVAACTNLTETAATFISPDKFYKTDAQAQIAVNAIYQPLMDWNGWKQPAEHSIMCDEDEDACESWMGGGRGGNIAGQWYAEGNSVWQGDYTMINRANQVLNYVGSSGGVTAEGKDKALGMAYFARAYAYFDLVRRFGAVPLHTVMYTPDANLGAQAAAPRDSIWNQITADLWLAAKDLPTAFDASNGSGLPRAASAWGLLAKVYLHMAGAETDTVPSLKAKRAQYLDSAVYAAQQAMADPSTSLQSKYMDNFDVSTQNGAHEILFAVQGNRGNGSNIPPFFSPSGDCSLVGGCGPAGPGFVHLRPDFVATFDPADKRWEKNVAWPLAWKSMPASQSQYKGLTIPVIHNDSFSVLEAKGLARRDSVLAYDGWTEGCESNRLYPGFYMVHMKDANGNMVGDTVAIPHTYYTLKYVDRGNTGDQYGNANNFVILRLADVLLVLAEAENERNAASPLAYQAVNLVRTRAGLPPLTPGLGQVAFRDSVWLERRHELYAEFQRRFDLIREGQYLTVMNAQVTPWFSSTPVVCRPRQAFELLQPIPNGELAANPKLHQNPGY